MSGPQFHETQRGRQFLESTLPALVREISRLADALERAVAALEAKAQADAGDDVREGERP